MKTQDLFVVSLAILLAAGVSFSQQPVQSAQAPQSLSGPSSNAQEGDTRTIIVKVKYYPINELGDLLRTLSQGEVTAVTDERSRSLILTASQKRMDQMLRLIQELDVPTMEAQQSEFLTCRVYMLELPSKGQSLKPFSMLLERPSPLPSGEALSAAKDANVQIVTLLQREEDDKWNTIIEGRAASNDAIQQVLAKIPNSQIKELKWDDETFTAAIPAAQLSRLPAPLQEHIRKFLGDEVQTVGYWFGNTSIPGDLNAPIGPWRLNMKTQPGQGTDLVLEVRVIRESPIPFVNETQLFSNTVQSRVGRPLIIGYNRDSYGTRVMGAMVVLLEADTTAPMTVEMKQQ